MTDLDRKFGSYKRFMSSCRGRHIVKEKLLLFTETINKLYKHESATWDLEILLCR